MLTNTKTWEQIVELVNVQSHHLSWNLHVQVYIVYMKLHSYFIQNAMYKQSQNMVPKQI